MSELKALRISILEDKEIGNCSNHGISERYDSILLLCDEGYIDVTGDEENLCKVVRRNLWGKEYLHVEPVKAPKGVGWMSGGTFVYSCDARFNRISEYPLSLHDRCESQELYNRLSN